MFGNMPSRLTDFGEVLRPSEAMEPILAKVVRGALMEWLTEIWAADELKEVGIPVRRKALFDGKPGVGKTTLAHHLSARLGLPMVAVRPEKLIDCWLGSTARNIGALFDAAKSSDKPCVLFIDEFDALAAGRNHDYGRGGAVQERNSFVDTLLQRMEQHDGFMIAATNFGGQIDPAIWRRFDIHMTLNLPGQFERERILARYLAPFGLPKRELAELAEAFDTASPALMRQFCEALKRHVVIGPRLQWDMRKESCIDRIVVAVQPHPELGKPRLWSHGGKDQAVKIMTWPLPKAADLSKPDVVDDADDPSDNVIALAGARK